MRDCKKCKHLVMYDYKNKSYSCESRECEFEPEEQEPTTKNVLAVDCISRKAALDITWQDPSYSDPLNVLTEVRDKIRELPSVTPQEPIIDKLRAEITTLQNRCYALTKGAVCRFCKYECEYKAEK